jgi:ABC-type Fe3+-hydroxamate transport system substrate-binding protein
LRTRVALLITTALAVLAPAAAAAPKRIVALTPFSANTLAEVGVGPVAIGQTLGGNERFHPKLRGVKVLPLAHPLGPNMEQLAALQPSLVFSSPTWAKGAETMRRLDIRVENADPGRVTDVARATRRIGKLAGRPKRAAKLAKRYERWIKRVTKDIEHRPRVLMILGVGRTPYAFLPNSWGGDLVTRAGGRLVTGGAEDAGGFARISDEKVIEEDPDVILAVPHAAPEDIDEIEASMKANELWKLTKAGQTGSIFVSTDNSLLQAGTDVARVIRTVRQQYLKNW